MKKDTLELLTILQRYVEYTIVEPNDGSISIPYAGRISGEGVTPYDVIRQIHEAGYLKGCHDGRKSKIHELKKVLEITEE